MIRRVACPPPPAFSQSATLHICTLTPDDTLFRVYRGDDPVQFVRSSRDTRFHPLPAPWDATEVLYAGSSPEVAISETVLRWHDRTEEGGKIILSRSQIQGRKLVALRTDGPLDLVDFTGFGMKPLTELVEDGVAEGIFLSDASSYSLTQEWGACFRSQCSRAAGFRWMSRHHNSSCCYVFFGEPCRGIKFLPSAPPEEIAVGTPGGDILQDCLGALGWEAEW